MSAEGSVPCFRHGLPQGPACHCNVIPQLDPAGGWVGKECSAPSVALFSKSFCRDASPAQAQTIQASSLYFWHFVCSFFFSLFPWHLLLPHITSMPPLGSCSAHDGMQYPITVLSPALVCSDLCLRSPGGEHALTLRPISAGQRSRIAPSPG